MTETGACWKSNPSMCSLTFVYNVLLNAGQNCNGLVDSIVMPQHEIFMCQLMYRSLNSAFKRWLEVAMFNVYRCWGGLYKSLSGTEGEIHSRCLIKTYVATKWTLGSTWCKFQFCHRWDLGFEKYWYMSRIFPDWKAVMCARGYCFSVSISLFLFHSCGWLVLDSFED